MPRKEASFGAIYWWMVKLGTAIAGLFSGIILYSVGFIAGAETQTEGAMDGLRFFYSAIPILGTLGAIYVMKDYDIDEQRAEEIKAELKQRNGY